MRGAHGWRILLAGPILLHVYLYCILLLVWSGHKRGNLKLPALRIAFAES